MLTTLALNTQKDQQTFKFLGVHISKGQEGVTGFVLLEQIKESPPAYSDTNELLLLYHQKHTDELHLRVVQQLLRLTGRFSRGK